jgi:hypothetical protein
MAPNLLENKDVIGNNDLNVLSFYGSKIDFGKYQNILVQIIFGLTKNNFSIQNFALCPVSKKFWSSANFEPIEKWGIKLHATTVV